MTIQPDLMPVPTNPPGASLEHRREHLDTALEAFRQAIEEEADAETAQINAAVLASFMQDGDENRAFRFLRLHTSTANVDHFAPLLRELSRAWHALQQDERRALRVLKSPA